MNTGQAPPPNPKEDVALAPPSPPVRRWWIALLGVVIFVCGGICGGGLTLHYLRNRVLYAIHHPQEMPDKLSQELRRRLGLSPEQTEKVRDLIAQRQRVFQKIRRETQPKVEAELEILRKEIESVLTPEQAQDWNARFYDMKRRWLPPPPAE